MPQKFVFVVHALSPLHRQVMGLRFRHWSLASGAANGSDPQHIRHICHFRYGYRFLGEVVGVPMPPELFLAHPEQALQRLIRAVHWSARDGLPPSAIGLGSLCSVVAGRGEGLQAHFDAPVTTGHAGTTWCLYQNIVQAMKIAGRQTVAILGASSPVGTALAKLLAADNIPVIVDSKKAARKISAVVVDTAEEAAARSKMIAGAATTGPYLDPASLQVGTQLFDISLPHTIKGPIPSGVQVWAGETMSMPSSWRRGFWGPIYHLVSGYGWNTVLACLLEPLMVLASGEGRPLAQGRVIQPEAVLRFGAVAAELGFYVKPRRMRYSLADKGLQAL